MVAERLIQITHPAATPDQLWQRVEAAWSAVPQEHIQSLFESMPRRMAAVISNNGSYSGRNHTSQNKIRKIDRIGEELILPTVEEVLKTVIPKLASDINSSLFKDVQQHCSKMFNNTVQRRIDEMSEDVESFLCDYLQMTHFSLQLDESTLLGNESLLLVYVRFIIDQEHQEEMRFAQELGQPTLKTNPYLTF
ncbi:SCAN domain-containing protein 3 [Trichonephila clavipes]|nr:SCAN domain-containing protein 3 [Trichonephila clavipes]